jgi:hypothetical protein
MAIDIGDAVLTFLGDTTQLDQAFDKVGTEAPAKMAPVQAALDATSDTVSELSGHVLGLEPATEKASESFQAMGTEVRGELNEARDTTELLGEAVGVRLPRAVGRFLADLPGVGTALNAAFGAFAIIFLIEWVAKGIEKIVEMREETHKLELAQETFGAAVANSFGSLDEKLLSAQIKADELAGDHFGALKKELELIDHQSLAELEHQFQILASAADALFKQLETSWYTFNLGSKGAEAALKDFKAQYDLLLATNQKDKASDLLQGTKKSAEDVLTLMQQFQALSKFPTDTWEQTNQKSAEEVKILGQLKALGVDINESKARTFGIDEKTLKSQEDLVAVLNAQANAQKEIADIASQNKANKTTEAANKAAEDADRIFKAQAEAQKRADDQEDKEEDDRRNKFIASFEEQEKEKIAATRQGSQERIQIIDAAIKDEEAHGFQDTAFYKSLQVQKVQAVQARIAQQQKAEQDADKQELSNAEQQAKRDVETVRESGTEQEKAIQDLGKARILSQSETSNRLIAVYQTEKDKVLGVLNNLLHEEQALMEKAANQLAQAKLNPAITPEQLQQAQQLLTQLKNAVANTETQIAKVKSDANAKQLAQDRSHYAQALALAVAFGHQNVAATLASNHALLLQHQTELLALKSRKDLTQAQQAQIPVLEKLIAEEKKEEKQLETTARQGLSVWKQFSSGFRDQAEQNVKSMQEMSAEMEQGVQSFGTVISGAFEVMVTSQESFGKAMLHGTEKMIGQMAEQWGEYFLAKGIADIFFDQPLGAAELAGGAALMAIGGALSGLGGSGGSGSSGSSASASTGTPGPAPGSPAATAGGVPVSTLNVPRLSGGLVTQPTIAVVGGAGGGGSAMKQIAAALASHGSSGGDIHIKIETDLLSSARVISNNVKTGRVRMTSSNTLSPRGRRS